MTCASHPYQQPQPTLWHALATPTDNPNTRYDVLATPTDNPNTRYDMC